VDSGVEEVEADGAAEAVVYPGENRRRVPCVFGMGNQESPTRSPAKGESIAYGYPVRATFFSGATVDDVEAVLKDGAGRKVGVILCTPQEPARREMPQPGTICLTWSRCLPRWTASPGPRRGASPPGLRA
jgi:hypothetical protein